MGHYQCVLGLPQLLTALDIPSGLAEVALVDGHLISAWAAPCSCSHSLKDDSLESQELYQPGGVYGAQASLSILGLVT